MIILGLGSNLPSSFGDRFQNIDLAISLLEGYGIKVIQKSSYYESPSYPNKNNPKFINIIIEISTDLPPIDLASILVFIEEKLQRKRKHKNDPRTCDIDIIDYNSQSINFTYKNLDFEVPHRELIYRNFVLFPLQEILPNWKHPITNDPVNALVGKLSNTDKRSIQKITKT